MKLLSSSASSRNKCGRKDHTVAKLVHKRSIKYPRVAITIQMTEIIPAVAEAAHNAFRCGDTESFERSTKIFKYPKKIVVHQGSLPPPRPSGSSEERSVDKLDTSCVFAVTVQRLKYTPDRNRHSTALKRITPEHRRWRNRCEKLLMKKLWASVIGA